MASTYRAGEMLFTLLQLAPVAGFFIRARLLESLLTPPQTPNSNIRLEHPFAGPYLPTNHQPRRLKNEFDQRRDNAEEDLAIAAKVFVIAFHVPCSLSYSTGTRPCGPYLPSVLIHDDEPYLVFVRKMFQSDRMTTTPRRFSDVARKSFISDR
jgi:hypothetical protein